jgi:hypothetical protein
MYAGYDLAVTEVIVGREDGGEATLSGMMNTGVRIQRPMFCVNVLGKIAFFLGGGDIKGKLA